MNRETFLAERRIAILATLDLNASPYLTAVWFMWEDGAFYIPTGGTSRKALNATARPRGAIAIDSRGAVLAGVRASGPIEVLRGETALGLNERIHRRFVTDAGMADPTLGGLLHQGDDVTLRLVPERWQSWDMEPVFGRRFGNPKLVRPLAA